MPDISLNYLLNHNSVEGNYLNNIVKHVNYNFQKFKNNTSRAFLLSGGAIIKNNRFYLSWDYSSKLFKRDNIDNFTTDCIKEFKKLSKIFNK